MARLRKAGLVDDSFQIQRDDEYVYIPVAGGSSGAPRQFPSMETVELDPVRSREKPRPRKAGGAFDLIGEIAITKIRNRERAVELARDLISVHPNIRAVYLDRGILGEYRLRDLELLEGDSLLTTRYRENGIIFELDVSRVYFSPRLATERMLVAKEAVDGETIIDMFAGIGAFSLNIARLHDVSITAIDSNPDAILYMNRCISLNSLKGSINPVNGDARDVMRSLPEADRIIMNLPHDAFGFLGDALARLKVGGTLHYYEILDIEGIAGRMEAMRSAGLEIRSRREVHGYSTTQSMFSLTAVKNRE